jgi:hypothetical protein
VSSGIWRSTRRRWVNVLQRLDLLDTGIRMTASWPPGLAPACWSISDARLEISPATFVWFVWFVDPSSKLTPAPLSG